MNFAATIANLRRENAALRAAMEEGGLELPTGSQALPGDAAALDHAKLSKTRETLTAALKTANESVTIANGVNAQLSETLNTRTAELAELRKQLATVTTERDSLKERVTKVESTVQEQVMETLCNIGVPPIHRAGDPSDGMGTRPDTSHLTGYARAVAAHRAS